MDEEIEKRESIETRKGVHAEKVHRLEFDNFVDFLAVAETGSPRSRYQDSRNSPNERWDLGDGWDATLKLAHSGWSEGVDKVMDISSVLIESVQKSMEMVNSKIMHDDVSGSLVNVPVYLSGLPENMISFDPVYRSNKVVRFGVSCAFSAYIPADVIVRRGAAIAAAVDLLEAKEIRCEVILQERVTGYINNESLASEWFVTLKKANMPLQIDQLAFAIAHPSMLRHLGFAVQENLLPDEWQDAICGSAYGQVDDTQEDDELRGDVYVPSMIFADYRWESEKSTEMWIKKILKEQGVGLL